MNVAPLLYMRVCNRSATKGYLTIQWESGIIVSRYKNDI